MLNKYLIENYDKLKDMAYNIAGVKGKDDLLSFVIEELYKCDQDRITEIIETINILHSQSNAKSISF